MILNDARACNGTHNIDALSYFTTGMSAFFLLSTLLINIFFIFLLSEHKKQIKTSMFFKLIFNIAVADLITSLISDVSSISFHAKEGLGIHIPMWQIRIKHWALFIVNGASILSMAVLSFNRMASILYPFKYRAGMDTWKSITIVLSTWVVSALLTIPYYYIGFIRYLGIFAAVTIVLTLISLIGAAIIYAKYLKPASRLSTQLSPTKQFDSVESAATSVSDIANNSSVVMNESTEDKYMDDSEKNNNNSTVITNESTEVSDKDVANEKAINKSNKPITLQIQSPSTQNTNETTKKKSLERSANKSFLLMLIVFLLTYLPAIVMTVYMNVCRNCDCVAIHCLRDLTYLAILSSALWRPLNFILRLKNIRRRAKELLCH